MNAPAVDAPAPRRTGNPLVRGFLALVILALIAMWVYAFGFAPKEGVNIVGDKAWAVRAEQICAEAQVQRTALADYRKLGDAGPNALAQRATIIEKANAILARMLDDLSANMPTDAKGQHVISAWLADYRTYLADRVGYVDTLRRTGDNVPFHETVISGEPISNYLGDVARQNRMTSCQAPLDLAG